MKVDKIYSRKRFIIPRLKGKNKSFNILKKDFFSKGRKATNNCQENDAIRRLAKTLIIVIIAIYIANKVITAIEPTVNILCIDMAKSIATKISNEQATIVMRKL